jgi:hypothetical protein
MAALAALDAEHGAPYSLPTGKPFERFGGPARSTQYKLI